MQHVCFRCVRCPMLHIFEYVISGLNYILAIACMYARTTALTRAHTPTHAHRHAHVLCTYRHTYIHTFIYHTFYMCIYVCIFILQYICIICTTNMCIFIFVCIKYDNILALKARQHPLYVMQYSLLVRICCVSDRALSSVT